MPAARVESQEREREREKASERERVSCFPLEIKILAKRQPCRRLSPGRPPHTTRPTQTHAHAPLSTPSHSPPPPPPLLRAPPSNRRGRALRLAAAAAAASGERASRVAKGWSSGMSRATASQSAGADALRDRRERERERYGGCQEKKRLFSRRAAAPLATTCCLLSFCPHSLPLSLSRASYPPLACPFLPPRPPSTPLLPHPPRTVPAGAARGRPRSARRSAPPWPPPASLSWPSGRTRRRRVGRTGRRGGRSARRCRGRRAPSPVLPGCGWS